MSDFKNGCSHLVLFIPKLWLILDRHWDISDFENGCSHSVLFVPKLWLVLNRHWNPFLMRDVDDRIW